jgi:SAM-dependent methyltransferase
MLVKNKYKIWEQCQNRLIEWRRQNPITNEMAMPGYDHSAQLISQYVFDHEKLLDIGCKTGGLLKSEFFPNLVNYYGLDPLRIEDAEYPFNFENRMIEDAVEIYGREIFDCAHIKDSIDYFCDLDKSFQSIRDVLKPGGILIITEGGFRKGRIREIISIFFRNVRRIMNRDYIHAHETYPNGDYKIDEIKAALYKSGFRIINEIIKDGRLDLIAKNG